MFSRNMEEKINRHLSNFPVVVLVGARQSGKTTLARKSRETWHYFDLERGRDYDFITGDFDFFFRQHQERVVIDEAQLSPQLFKELRGVVDENRSCKGRFLLTGSSSPELARHIAESLAGRVAIVEIGTLKMNERYREPLPSVYALLDRLPPEEHLPALREISASRSVADVLHHFLKGGYPEPAMEDREDFQADWMANYEQTYVQRDVRRLFPSLNIENYRRFIAMLSELSGTIINRSEVGRTLGASESAIRDYLDIAQGTFIWRILTSFERTASKSVVKMPRGYLRDSGLLHHLLHVRRLEQLYTRPGTGSAFEGFMIEEIIQGFRAVETASWTFNFYRTRGGAEVDLVLTSPDRMTIPVEIKFGEAVRRSDLRSLSAFIAQEECPYGIVINNSAEVRMLTDRIIQLPSGCF